MPTIILPPDTQPKRERGWQLPPAARYACAAIGFLTPATWLAMAGGCIRWPGWGAVCEPVSYGLAPLVIGTGVLGVMGLNYLDRAFRRSRKGMWTRHGGPGWGQTLQLNTKSILWGSADDDAAQIQITGEMRFERRRWKLRVKNGQRIYVDRRVFWLWLEQVEALVPTLKPGQSPVKSKLWEGKVIEGYKLKEGDILAFCDILQACGRFHYPTPDPRSRQYVSRPGAAAWSVCEEFEKIQRSEEY